MAAQNRQRRGRNNKRPTRRTILLVTNGRETESAYLSYLKRTTTLTSVKITIKHINGEPESVLRALRSPNGDTSGFDEVWIIVDEDGVDRETFVRDCQSLTTSKQTWHAIVSRPCFEVWLIAHYEPVRRYQNQKEAQKHYRACIGAADRTKRIPADFPYKEVATAVMRVQLGSDRNSSNSEYPPNPGTSMPTLLKRLHLL